MAWERQGKLPYTKKMPPVQSCMVHPRCTIHPAVGSSAPSRRGGAPWGRTWDTHLLLGPPLALPFHRASKHWHSTLRTGGPPLLCTQSAGGSARKLSRTLQGLAFPHHPDFNVGNQPCSHWPVQSTSAVPRAPGTAPTARARRGRLHPEPNRRRPLAPCRRGRGEGDGSCTV